jgi:hypothetical protein
MAVMYDPRRISRRNFWQDLTRTRHMTAVSAVVLGTTFMPLLGVPDIEELRTFQSAVEGFSDARASVLTPRRDDEAARERSARSVIPEGATDDRSGNSDAGAQRVLTVERSEQQAAAPIDAVALEPLPALDDPEPMAPVEGEALPGLPPEAPMIDEKPEAPLSEEEPVPEEEPLPEDEEL